MIGATKRRTTGLLWVSKWFAFFSPTKGSAWRWRWLGRGTWPWADLLWLFFGARDTVDSSHVMAQEGRYIFQNEGNLDSKACFFASEESNSIV